MRLFIILFLFIAPVFFAQEVIVEGTIDQVVSLKDVRGQPTYFNMDGQFPNHKFTLLLWGSDKDYFREDVFSYEGKSVKVTGLIETYRGKPQIVIRELYYTEIG